MRGRGPRPREAARDRPPPDGPAGLFRQRHPARGHEIRLHGLCEKPEIGQRRPARIADFSAAINHYFAGTLLAPRVNIWLPESRNPAPASGPATTWRSCSRAAEAQHNARHWRRPHEPRPRRRVHPDRLLHRHACRHDLPDRDPPDDWQPIRGPRAFTTAGRRTRKPRSAAVRPLPPRLLAHMRRWVRPGLSIAILSNGTRSRSSA